MLEPSPFNQLCGGPHIATGEDAVIILRLASLVLAARFRVYRVLREFRGWV